MARLTYVYRAEDVSYVNVGRRQLPVVAGDNLMMLMDLNNKGLSIDSPHIRGKELEEFTRKFNLLTTNELRCSLEIDSDTFVSVLNQCVQCVGCRRRVERLFYQLTLSGYATLDPLVLNNNCTLSISEEKLKTPQALGTLLYRHHEVLNNLLESKLRNKTRCVLHSLDAFRSKPFSETWREIWSSMKHNCRDELAVIETKELHEVLETYLKKHKFCQGCRTKIEKAYKILVGESSTKEKGFVAALYSNIKKCHPDKHIHVITNKVDFLDALIRRAEPEVNGSYSKLRERHAKTLEIAQEEVLTCVGMIMYERLRRIYVSLREEERACQVLAAVGVHALCRSFDLAVEKKQGISNLELLYQEISRAERAKEHKRELRKLKKKKKKIEKRNLVNSNHCQCDASDEEEEEDDEEKTLEDKKNEHSDEIENDYEDEAVIMIDEPEVHVETTDDTTEIININLTTNIKAKQLSKRQKQKQQRKINKQQQSEQSKKEQRSQKKHNVASVTDNMKQILSKCDDCLATTPNCPCESDVKDSGYGSEPNSQRNSRTSSNACSPEGSEVSCLDGFCNHGGESSDHSKAADLSDVDDEQQVCLESCCLTAHAQEIALFYDARNKSLSLQQMLDDCKDDVENEENCYIPRDVIIAYQCQQEQVRKQRQQLRETLRQNFARFCACRVNK